MRTALRSLMQDWEANQGNPKGRLICLLFRFAQALRGPGARPRAAAVPVGIAYRVTVEWLLGVELPWRTSVGPGLRIDHGQCLVVNDRSVIGANVTLRNGTTLGAKRTFHGGFSGGPRIGDSVDIGSNACVIGEVTIGDWATVGAGTVVTRDVPSGAIVVGNPARVLEGREGRCALDLASRQPDATC